MAKTTVPSYLSAVPSIIDAGDATAITIDSSENLSIGGQTNHDGAAVLIAHGDSGVTTYSDNADELVIENAGNAGISILTPANGTGSIIFGDSNDDDIGKIEYNHSTDDLTFTAADDINLVTGSGNVGVTGTMSVSGAITGTLATAAQTNITSVGTLTGLEISSGTSDFTLTKLTNTNNDAYPARMTFVKNSANPATDDDIGKIDFYGEDSAGNSDRFAFILASTPDVTSGSEDGSLEFYTLVNGSTTNTMAITGGNVGIGQASPSATTGVARFLHIGDSSTAHTGLILEDNTNKWEIQVNEDLHLIDGSTERFRFTDQTEIGIGGQNYGTDGQVLTSGGAGAAVAWEDAAGGATTLDGLTDAKSGGTNFTNSLIVGHQTTGTLTSTATQNTFIGYASGDNVTSGGSNTALGYNSLGNNYSGAQNVAVGAEALDALQNGANNTALGYEAAGKMTSGGDSVAIGRAALLDVTSTSGNTAVGVEAGENITSTENTAIGKHALRGSGSLSGNRNVGVGVSAGKVMTSGYENVTIGYNVSETLAGGFYNVHIGAESAGTTSSVHGQVIIGSRCHASGNASEQTVLGYNNSGYSGGWFTVVDPDGKSYINPGQTSWSGTSDAGYKENIATSTAGLSFINDLRPVTFTYRKKKDIDATLQGYTTDAVDGEKYYKGDSSVNHGFIAQEVKTAIDNHSEVKDGHKVWRGKEPDQFYEEDKDAVLYIEGDEIPEGKEIGDIRKPAQVEGELARLGDGESIAEGELIPMLVKAIQELSAKNDALETRIATLESS